MSYLSTLAKHPLTYQRRINMRFNRFLLCVVLTGLSTVGFAESDAQKSFTNLKTLAGSWQGTYDGKPVQVSLRVTSMGNTLMHEMTMAGHSDDPITMLYLEGDRLLLTHYCDAGNRLRMTAQMKPDGKTVEFNFLDVANFSTAQGGYMRHAIFTTLDQNHHSEDWTFPRPGKASQHAL
jgi:hypothetical protein